MTPQPELPAEPSRVSWIARGELPRSPRRILVLGRAGAGKSTLARRIGAGLGVPVVHLDKLFWNPGWVAVDRPTFQARIEAVAASPAWILDGTYSFSFRWTMARAELVIWAECPRHVSIRRLLGQAWYPPPGRTDQPGGGEKKVYWDFLRKAWDYDRKMRPSVEWRLDHFGPTVPRVHVDRETDVDALIARLR